MKVPRKVEYTSKINNCIDELLMQDTTFNQQARKDKYAYEQNGKINKRQLNKNNYDVVKDRKQHVQRSDLKQSSQSSSIQKQRINFRQRRQRRGREHAVNVNNDNKQQQKQVYHKQGKQQKQTNSLCVNNYNNTSKKEDVLSTKAEQKYRTINVLNKQQINKLRLKKTYSYQVKDDDRIDRINQKDDNKLFDDHVQQKSGNDDDSHSPTYLLGVSTGRDDGFNNINNDGDNNSWLITSNDQINPNRKRKAKHPSITDNLRNRLKQNQLNYNKNQLSFATRQHINHYGQNLSPPSFIDQHQHAQYQHPLQQHPTISQPKGQQQQFHLTHQQLQFLSLLYPNESPQQLMLKLLSYYEQQQMYNNSFQQLFQKNQLQASRHQFFRTRHEIGNTNQKDSIIELQEQTQMHDQNGFNHNNTQFVKQNNNNTINTPTPKSNFSKLKQQCLASIGQQMVQTQIKSSLAQTVNVNYYTRQYAMPIIMETINMKNQQSQHKLLKLQEFIKAKQQKQAQKIQQEIIMTLNQQKIAAVLAENYESINSQSINIPTEFTHKVYIPANSRGQSFEMDYKPDSKLFEYITQNEYRRILRDINHLIQKVLSYHRHSSFLKRKNNSLLRGWNLALLIFLFLIIIMLCVRSFFTIESQHLQIIVFFCLSFIVILILGNSFNNYKRNVKRSSVIKDICQQLSNYLDFINSSNKNIKWVLGKDFFWLEIWIDVIKNNKQVKK